MPVIQLTRLNDRPLVVNSDLIKLIENANDHDTVLTLINGEKIVVRERVPEVIERVIGFRRSVLAGMPISGANLALLTSPQDQSASDQDDPQPEGSFRG
jgi:flagellar protein FlbD